MRGARYLIIPLCLSAFDYSSAYGQSAETVPVPLPEAATAAAPPPEAPDPEADCLRMRKEGRELLKAGEIERGLARLQEAVAAGLQAKIGAEAQSVLHYSYALALARHDKGKEAIAQFRLAVKLAPDDVDIRSDLASALIEEESYDEAIREVQAALLLKKDAEQTRELTATLKKARSERLKERLSVKASVEVGYDSNILQGKSLTGTEIQTIAGRSTGSAAHSVLTGRSGSGPKRVGVGTLGSGYAAAITDIYQTPSPSVSEAGVPIGIDLDLDGRVAAGGRVELWLGYSFSQLIQTFANQDAYNFQQHKVSLRLETKLGEKVALDISATGFADFSGLSSFAAFQGGIEGALKLTIKESRRWRTIVTYAHKYAASFAAEDAALNADSDDLRVAQELRLKPVRLRLGYQLHDVRSGVLVTPVDYELMLPTTGPRMTQPDNLALGQYLYSTPLGYLGNQVATKLHADLPAKILLDFNASYEYRLYDGVYSATFTPNMPQLALPQGSVATSVVTLPAKQRADHVVALGLAIEKELPRGFSVGLAYAFTDNLSNISNSLDNRSYTKHAVTLTGAYEF